MKVPGWLATLLGVLSAVGPVSTDMYLPAFPAIEAAMGGRPGTAQVTLATWFLGLAVGQITQGTLSDRFGRRGPLIVGTLIYTAASVGCALSANLATLSTMRALAAFGGSASMVIPRAMVRDMTEGYASARLMSRLILVMGAVPVLAPTLGGLVLGFADWHAIFWIAAAYGGVCCLMVWRFLPDTLPPGMRTSLDPARTLHRYADIIVERGFITHTLMGGFAMFGMFAYLGGSPDVFISLFHLSPPLYGTLFGCNAVGYIAASQISPRLLPRFGAHRVLRTAARVFLVAMLVLAAVAVAHPGPWWLVIAPISVGFCAVGFIMPNAVVGALARHAQHAGSASALMGTLQFCLGAVSGVAVGLLSNGSVVPMASLLLVGALGANVADALRPRAVFSATAARVEDDEAEPSRTRLA